MTRTTAQPPKSERKLPERWSLAVLAALVYGATLLAKAWKGVDPPGASLELTLFVILAAIGGYTMRPAGSDVFTTLILRRFGLSAPAPAPLPVPAPVPASSPEQPSAVTTTAPGTETDPEVEIDAGELEALEEEIRTAEALKRRRVEAARRAAAAAAADVPRGE